MTCWIWLSFVVVWTVGHGFLDLTNDFAITFLLILIIFTLVQELILTYIIRCYDAKNVSYYMGVVHRAILYNRIFLKKKKKKTYAVLPIGYTNIHFTDDPTKNIKHIISINVDRNKKNSFYFL